MEPTHDKNSQSSPHDPQIERLFKITEETRHALWGHNGTPGLLTRMELLQDQVSRLSDNLETHIKECQEDRQRWRELRGRVTERLFMWAVIGALAAVLIGGKLWFVQEVTQTLQQTTAPGIPSPSGR